VVSRIVNFAIFALSSSTALFADFQYQQTTKITGGFLASMARFGGKQATEPTTSTIAVKGNRMVHLSPRSAEIIDLDKETITHVDFDKKTYSVMTFAEMKQMLQDAAKQMQQRDGEMPDVSFTASVRETDKAKDVNGVSTKEYILTMAMNATDQKTGQAGAINITNDMWMAPEVPGYEEVREFQRRMGAKLGEMFTPGSNPMMSMRPGMGKGLAEMAKEMSKLKGTALLTVTRMGSTADGKPLPAASEAPELSAQSQAQMPNMGEAAGHAAEGAATGAATSAADSAMGRLGHSIPGGLGGFGGFGKKKQQPQQPPPDQQQTQQAGNRPAAGAGTGGGLLMESTTEMSGFSAGSVDASKFDVPAGFKQVQPEMGRRGR